MVMPVYARFIDWFKFGIKMAQGVKEPMLPIQQVFNRFLGDYAVRSQKNNAPMMF